jgi:transcription antitermination factor NusG
MEGVSIAQEHGSQAYPAMEIQQTPAPDWYAIYTRPSHEKSVVKHFAVREIECYLPSYRTTRRWRNRLKVELELPLFPGYVFAQFPWSRHGSVLEVSSVVSIVGNGREALPLRKDEIQCLRAGLVRRRAEPHPSIRIGERARIASGALEGYEGVVVRRSNGVRVVLSLQQIVKGAAMEMPSVSVEVEECDLEWLGNKS